MSWKPSEGGYEITNSPEIISNTLVVLKKKRGFVALLHKGYQSGGTVLVEINENSLLLDKPVDWPGTSSIIRVVLKDETKVWNHFTVKVTNTSKDTLKTAFPTELFRLQRRGNFRISVPKGSYASFSRKGSFFGDATIKDMSARGLLLSLDEKNVIVGESTDDTIQDIVIQIADGADNLLDQNDPITVYSGRIVREIVDSKSGLLIIGVELAPKMNEEKELLKYVRWRELEMLRKGIKN